MIQINLQKKCTKIYKKITKPNCIQWYCHICTMFFFTSVQTPVVLLPSMCNESDVLTTEKMYFFRITGRDNGVFMIDGKLLYSVARVSLHTLDHVYRERIVISAPPSSVTSRHGNISNVLHHVRPIEPSRAVSPGLPLAQWPPGRPNYSRAPSARSVSNDRRPCINHNSRTETYVNISQFDKSSFEASWLLFAINPTRHAALSPVKSIVLGKIRRVDEEKWWMTVWLNDYASR